MVSIMPLPTEGWDLSRWTPDQNLNTGGSVPDSSAQPLIEDTPLEGKLRGQNDSGKSIGSTTFALMVCQALYYATVSVDLTLTALVGLALAPTPVLATLPLAMITLMGAICSVLTGLACARFGYTPVMVVGAILGALGAAVSTLAVVGHSFPALCVGTGIVGVYRATGGYIRLMGADLTSPGQRDRALSMILAGGLVAAFVGPWLATSTMDVLPEMYAGSYLVVVALCLLTLPILLALLRPERRHRSVSESGPARVGGPGPDPVRWRDLEQPRNFVTALVTLAVAGAVMTMVMAIGPIGSEHAGHSVTMGTTIIQWHMVGMFAPSLFSGLLLEKFGRKAIALSGAALLASGAIAGVAGGDFLNFLLALVLNGLGWNFLYVAGSSYLVICYPPGRGGRLQAVAEGIGSVTAVIASFSASAIFLGMGWQGTNIGALVVSGGLGIWILAGRRR
ncbi:MFS transporter [Arthrobacter terricola]